MQNLTCSLVALAMLAMRCGNFEEAARLFGQASVSPDAEQFLEDTLAHNLEARALVSASSANGIKEAVKAMSSAFQELGEDDNEDETISMSMSSLEDAALAENLDATMNNLEDLDQTFEGNDGAENLGDDQSLESGITNEDTKVMTLSSVIRLK